MFHHAAPSIGFEGAVTPTAHGSGATLTHVLSGEVFARTYR